MVAILASRKVSTAHNELIEERYVRMVAEEKFEKVKSRMNLLESQFNKSQEEIISLKDSLDKEKMTVQSLRLDMEKAQRLNAVLQRELQNALVVQPEPMPSE